MRSQQRSASSDDSEEARAFLQAREALFWKGLFFFFLLASGLGAVGAVKDPGVDLLLTMAVAATAGGCWWLCSRGQRSMRFSRMVETAGLLLVLIMGSFINRYVLAGFIDEHSVSTSEGVLMADAFVCLLGQGGTALKMAIRAALIPSTPRRTIVLTAMLGVPLIGVSTALVPSAVGGLGGLAWRALDSAAYPWLPATAVMMWGFAVCLFYLVMTRYAPETFREMFGTNLWFGIRNISSGLFGLPVAFLVTWIVSLMTAAPSKEMQDFVDSIRVPRGSTVAAT